MLNTKSGLSAEVGIAQIRIIPISENNSTDKENLSSYIFSAEGENTISLYIDYNGFPTYCWDAVKLVADKDVRTGEKVKIAAVREFDTNIFSLYIDGEIYAQVANNDASATIPLKAPTVAANSNGKSLFNGKIIDLRLWNIALGLTDIENNIRNGYYSISGNENGLISAWNFNNNITHILESIPNKVAGGSKLIFKGTRRDQWFDYSVPEEIGNESAFDSNKNITCVDIPATVLSIKDYAFFNCTSLNKVIVRENNTEIGEEGFGYCRY